jgi:hypothetical protein
MSKADAGKGERPPLVEGQIVIAAQVPAFRGAAVHVSLEDVSHADVASAVVARAVLLDVDHEPRRSMVRRGGEGRGTVIRFALHAAAGAPDIDARHDYSVRVWVDRDGDGAAGPGDLFSDERHPVLTHGFGRVVEVRLAPR